MSRPLSYLLACLLVLIVLLAVLAWLVSPRSSKLAPLVDSFNAGYLDEVITSADAVLAAEPRDVEAILHKAFALAQKGSLEMREVEYGQQAVALAEAAIAIDPNNSEAYRILGYANEIMQRYEAAHVAYDRAVALDPKNAAAISQKAHAYDLEGKFEEAESGYRAALSLQPSLAQASMGLARIEVRRGALESALARFRAAIDTADNARLRAEAAHAAGSITHVLGDSTEGERLMRRALALDPNFALAWEGLGEILFDTALATTSAMSVDERNAQVSEAFEAVTHAISIYPFQTAAHFQLAVQLAALDRTEQALEVLQRARKEIVPYDITLNAPDKELFLARIDALTEQLK